MHLYSVLPLLEKGVTPGTPIQFEESEDYDFWDRYFKVPGDPANPYVDPLTRDRRIATHPHSNVATFRKGTFAASWKAAEVENRPDNTTWWTLAADWAERFERKALRKGGIVHRVPVVELGVFLFWRGDWADEATARTIEQVFRDKFKMSDAEYGRLFVYIDETPDQIFTT